MHEVADSISALPIYLIIIFPGQHISFLLQTSGTSCPSAFSGHRNGLGPCTAQNRNNRTLAIRETKFNPLSVGTGVQISRFLYPSCWTTLKHLLYHLPEVPSENDPHLLSSEVCSTHLTSPHPYRAVWITCQIN